MKKLLFIASIFALAAQSLPVQAMAAKARQLRTELASGIQKNINAMSKSQFDAWFTGMQQSIQALKPLEASAANQYQFRMRGMISQSNKRSTLSIAQKQFLGLPLTQAEKDEELRTIGMDLVPVERRILHPRISYYEMLNVSPTADINLINQAYRDGILLYHPDKWKPELGITQEEAQQIFDRLTNARKILTNPKTRTQYDEILTLKGPEQAAAQVGNENTEKLALEWQQKEEGPIALPPFDEPAAEKPLQPEQTQQEMNQAAFEEGKALITQTPPPAQFEAMLKTMNTIDGAISDQENQTKRAHALGRAYQSVMLDYQATANQMRSINNAIKALQINATTFPPFKPAPQPTEEGLEGIAELFKEATNAPTEQERTAKMQIIAQNTLNPSNDYYQILGVQQNAPVNEIKEKFQELALVSHPDKLQQKGISYDFTDKLFPRYLTAYRTLMNQKERAKYDRILKLEGAKKAAEKVGKENTEQLAIAWEEIPTAKPKEETKTGQEITAEQALLNELKARITKSVGQSSLQEIADDFVWLAGFGNRLEKTEKFARIMGEIAKYAASMGWTFDDKFYYFVSETKAISDKSAFATILNSIRLSSPVQNGSDIINQAKNLPADQTRKYTSLGKLWISAKKYLDQNLDAEISNRVREAVMAALAANPPADRLPMLVLPPQTSGAYYNAFKEGQDIGLKGAIDEDIAIKGFKTAIQNELLPLKDRYTSLGKLYYSNREKPLVNKYLQIFGLTSIQKK